MLSATFYTHIQVLRGTTYTFEISFSFEKNNVAVSPNALMHGSDVYVTEFIE